MLPPLPLCSNSHFSCDQESWQAHLRPKSYCPGATCYTGPPVWLRTTQCCQVLSNKSGPSMPWLPGIDWWNVLKPNRLKNAPWHMLSIPCLWMEVVPQDIVQKARYSLVIGQSWTKLFWPKFSYRNGLHRKLKNKKVYCFLLLGNLPPTTPNLCSK